MDRSRSPPKPETRFHYPQYRNQQPQQAMPGYAHASQYQQSQQFPPHPSVRVPPNVRLAARQVPAGVGISPPPVRYEAPQQPQRDPGSGRLVQDFRFPTASNVRQDSSLSPGRKYNAHDSSMSSVLDDFAAPGTTPGSRSRGFPTPVRYSGSVYAESEALGVDERYDQDFLSPIESSRPSSADASPQILRQASLGKRARPAMTTIKNKNGHLDHDLPEDPPAYTQTSRTNTINALSAAVAAGVSNKNSPLQIDTPGSRSTPVRMPFDTSPPSSPSADREFLQTPKSPMTMASHKFPEQTPRSLHSNKSSNPLLGLGIDQPAPAMSDRVPPGRRPPQLDMDAVRDVQNRGSTTSLADLIKRATRLAANLDRGKTASRLGMLDMWGSTDKLSGNNRQSTMSDMISAFPAPAVGGTPTTRRDGAWPLSEKGDAYASTTDLSRYQPTSQRRKCCGMSIPVFFSFLVIATVLIAAAVLIPIFLVLVPKEHSTDNKCATSHPCHNGGTSIVSADACVCVCSNGFTGSSCDTSGDTQDCMTMTLNDGTTQYENATIGLSVLPSLTDAQSRFNISLNVSTILSVFSLNNLSCTSENSLADFNSTDATTKTKRFVVLAGLEPGEPVPILANPAVPEVSERALPVVAARLQRRQTSETIGTSNGIVFQATTATSIGAISTPTAAIGTDVSTVTSVGGTTSATGSAATATSSSTDASATGSSSNSTSSTVTDEELEFARVVVLYVLQQSQTVSVAVNAQEQMESFFSTQTGGNGSSTVDVGTGNLHLTANFTAFTITNGDGVVVGGESGS
ncbi:hypothetical protein EDD37DRAFT_81182 [Exophiala viscosa]|uniref:EGF-like domain-containing protein n=1 Tax=Exophiala viscosa TaxID=2486360 RepID=A0AAN6IG87_9EURO|nr:hypothetical protein EDD36DRAFT_134247 [Exophiala viscosa]KAI1630057.1 hypothetical protein EDD37DRAFT_81182 [Exophiala viscosa]